MNGIKPATEKKLLEVIEKTAAYVNAGLSPNDAVIKSAREHQVRPSEVGLVVQAYNTGRTNRQREDGDTIFAKTAEFELADTATVLEALYPSQVKQASAADSLEGVLSPEYTFSPRPMLERKTRWEKKAAGQQIDWRVLNGETIETPPPLPRDEAAQLRKQAGDRDRLRRQMEEARRQKAASLDQAGHAFRELTNYFRTPDAIPLSVVKEAAAILHGPKGVQVIEQLVDVTPALTKLANHRIGTSLLGPVSPGKPRVTVDDIDATVAPFPQIATLLEKVAAYKTSSDLFEKMYQKYAELAPSSFQPAGVRSVLDQSSAKSQEKTAASMMSPLGMLGGYSMVKTVGGDMASRMGGPDKDQHDNQQVEEVLNKLNDPAHETKLREVNARASLQDFMLNDPVISGYDPEEVAGAYNEIVQISPSVSDQRMLMQTLLRKRLQQGQLDTFDQNHLLDFENQLRKQVQPSGSGRSGGGSVI